MFKDSRPLELRIFDRRGEKSVSGARECGAQTLIGFGREKRNRESGIYVPMCAVILVIIRFIPSSQPLWCRVPFQRGCMELTLKCQFNTKQIATQTRLISAWFGGADVGRDTPLSSLSTSNLAL